MNERIKKIRKELSLTLEEFGEKLGVTRSAIGHIEKGIRNVTEQMFLLICREFNVNENWLRTGEGEMFRTSPKTKLEVFCKEYNLNTLECAILEKYLNLSSSERKAVFDFVMDIFNGLNKLDNVHTTKTNVYNTSLDKLSINEKVELYRQELELEEKAVEKSKALQKNA